MVRIIRSHHAERPMSWRRLAPTAKPGMNKAPLLRVSRTAAPPNNAASKTVATPDSSTENNVHHQYSDLLDLLLKSKYLLNPEETAWVKFI
jgi:hypothetical protein